ncbi:ABC transporter permease, partial [Persicitalea sp.]|uniref:ABC transporter permease n=1 Tax=Persicitalea sp. TaxID=3100273 RepID=UPI00359309E6
MIRNYLIIAWRNLRAHKVFSLVSIIGLSLGVTSLIVLLHYAQSERSYDGFHENADHIYRIRNDHYRKGELTSQRATTYRNTGPSLAADFPEVRGFARLTGTFGNSIVISPQGENSSGQPFFEESFF